MEPPMRILMVGPSDAIAMRRPMEWALRRGHQVCLVDVTCPDFGRAYQVRARKHLRGRKQLRFVPIWPRHNTWAGDFVPAAGSERVRDWLRVVQLRAVATIFKPDVIHAYHLLPPTGWCVQARLKPLVVSAWGSLNGLLEGRQQVAQAPDVEAVLRAAAALIVETPALVAACQALPAAPRVALLPLGADTRHFSAGDGAQRTAWRRSLAIPAGSVVLLSPRNWLAVYNHDLILAAFALARPGCRRPVTLVFVKIHPEDARNEARQAYEQVRRQVDTLGLADAVRWLPRLRYEMMPSLYTMADIVVNYPAQDAFPSTLIEAAACERPIISARLPGYRHTFVEEFCTLVEPGQPAALAEAMVELVNGCPRERSARLAQARQVIVAAYDERICEAGLFQLYRDVACGAIGRRAANAAEP